MGNRCHTFNHFRKINSKETNIVMSVSILVILGVNTQDPPNPILLLWIMKVLFPDPTTSKKYSFFSSCDIDDI